MDGKKYIRHMFIGDKDLMCVVFGGFTSIFGIIIAYPRQTGVPSVAGSCCRAYSSPHHGHQRNIIISTIGHAEEIDAIGDVFCFDFYSTMTCSPVNVRFGR